MRMLCRIELVAAWLAVVWAAAPLAQVAGAGLAVAVPLVVVVVGVALEELERHGGGCGRNRVDGCRGVDAGGSDVGCARRECVGGVGRRGARGRRGLQADPQQ
ncbi:hypothetical protein [Nonomuraea typhae]|uniref:Secreted protein n=1 Tax=Nonomuraea typhae TaxID=2603600 RepID=A0ABW7YMT2_9ACTN